MTDLPLFRQLWSTRAVLVPFGVLAAAETALLLISFFPVSPVRPLYEFLLRFAALQPSDADAATLGYHVFIRAQSLVEILFSSLAGYATAVAVARAMGVRAHVSLRRIAGALVMSPVLFVLGKLPSDIFFTLTAAVFRFLDLRAAIGVPSLLLERVLVTAIVQAPFLYIVPALAVADRFGAAFPEGNRLSMRRFRRTILLIAALGVGYAGVSILGVVMSARLTLATGLLLAAVHVAYLAAGNLFLYTFISVRAARARGPAPTIV